eukprot:36690-Eustigmatos_ZCMA.PRE.1
MSLALGSSQEQRSVGLVGRSATLKTPFSQLLRDMKGLAVAEGIILLALSLCRSAACVPCLWCQFDLRA